MMRTIEDGPIAHAPVRDPNVPTNEEVDGINNYVLSKIEKEEKTYFNFDTVCHTEITDEIEESLYSQENLNSFKVSGNPNHKLSLKVGLHVTLLRNIDQPHELRNGIRLKVIRIGDHVVEAQIISGNNIRHTTYMPRMRIISSDKKIPFKFYRMQFSLVVSFAMSINKSHGHSILYQVWDYFYANQFSHMDSYTWLCRE